MCALDFWFLVNIYWASTIYQDSSFGKHMVINFKDAYTVGDDQMCTAHGAKNTIPITQVYNKQMR
jgi:hypothetical protein